MEIVLKQKKQAFSLLEMIVSLAIIGVILILFFNVITNVIDVSIKTNARSQARTELENITNLLRQDIRNAEDILECGGETEAQQVSCSLITNSGQITWKPCDDNTSDRKSYCRYVGTGTDQSVTYRTPDTLTYEYISFTEGFAGASDSSQRNLQFIFSASHVNSDLNINNLTTNNIISTRNYTSAANPELIECGNGIVELGEQCDDGNTDPNDGCDLCAIRIDVDLDADGDCVVFSCYDDPRAAQIAADLGVELYVTSVHVQYNSGNDRRGCALANPESAYVFTIEGNVCGRGNLSASMTCSSSQVAEVAMSMQGKESQVLLSGGAYAAPENLVDPDKGQDACISYYNSIGLGGDD